MNYPFLADGRITHREYGELVNIQCGLGVWGRYNVVPQVRKDAGKLADAVQTMDLKAAAVIERRYVGELSKGDCQGGPKQIKPGSAVKKTLARIALNFRHNAT